MARKACSELKYFEVDGYSLRMLGYQINLANQSLFFEHRKEDVLQEIDETGLTDQFKKPDNSEEKINIVVKGLEAGMTDEMLEKFFESKYGPVQNCKVSKEADGRPRTYGFVCFKEGRHANRAILDSKSGNCKFKLEWYKILAQRQIEKQEN